MTTPAANYSADQFPALIDELGLAAFSAMFKQVAPLIGKGDQFAPPGVPTFITYGYNVSTVSTAISLARLCFLLCRGFCPPQATHWASVSLSLSLLFL